MLPLDTTETPRLATCILTGSKSGASAMEFHIWVLQGKSSEKHAEWPTPSGPFLYRLGRN